MRIFEGITQKTSPQAKNLVSPKKPELKQAEAQELGPAALYESGSPSLAQQNPPLETKLDEKPAETSSKAQLSSSPSPANSAPTTLLQEGLEFPTLGLSSSTVSPNISTLGGPGISAERIQAIKEVPDPALRNNLITQYYSDVGREFRDCIGPEGGVNWCAWASWASNHVGITVRGEDFPWLKPLAYGSAVAGAAIGGIPGAMIGMALVGTVEHMVKKSSEAITAGNDEIFERTAPHYTKFVETFKDDSEPNPAKLKKFLQEIGPDGRSEDKGYTRVKRAFSNYYEAKFESDPKKKKELVLLGNAQLVWDEQITAQKDIEDAIPLGSRKIMTKFWLTVPLQGQTLRLGEDLPPLSDGSMYPKDLETIDNPELKGVLNYFGVKDTTEGCASKDYTKLDQRMHFILNMFRSKHEEMGNYADTFSESQRHYLRQGLQTPDMA